MTYQLLTQYDAKNWTPGASAGRKVTGITLHWWGNPVGQTFEGIVDWFCNPRSSVTTSAHYVAEAGRVACIVNPDDIAWHAGDWAANVATIGIECNPRATDADYQTIGELVAYLRGIYGNVPLYPHRHWTQTTCPGVYDINRIDAIARGGKSGAAIGPAAATTITPIQEEDIMASIEDLKNALKSPDVLEAIGKTVHTRPVPYFDPNTGKDSGRGTTLAVLAGAADFQHAETRRVLASAAGAIVDAVKAAQPQDAARVAQAAYDEFLRKLDATTIKVATNG